MTAQESDNECRRAATPESSEARPAGGEAPERVLTAAELTAAREAFERSNEALRQQREWFRVTLASIADAVITTDTAGHINFLNPVAEAMTGVGLEAARGQPLEAVLRIINEDSGEPLANPAAEVLRTGEPVARDHFAALVRSNGRRLSIEDSAAPIRDANGQVCGAVMVFRDVTDRRCSERALRANEDRLRDSAKRLQLAMTAGSMGDWVWDAQTDLVSPGPRAAQLLGLPPNAPMSREQMFALVCAEDRERVRAEFDRALGGRVDYRVEFRVLRPKGEVRWVADRGRGVYADDGTTVGMIGVLQDVTERRNADEVRARLAAVVESSTDAIVSKTLEGIIATWNHGAEVIFGYTAEEAIGQSIMLLIPPDQADEEPAILERLKRGERIEHYQTVRRRKDGELIDVSLSVSPIKDADGRIIGAAKIARDITHEKRFAETLLETDRRKDEFLATLAHELRNPLAPIRQAALVSQAPDATEAQKRWSHEVISRQVQHMALLLDDLLDVSRITRGTLSLRFKMASLSAIVDAAVETARPIVESKRHTLTVQMPPEPVGFAADPLRLSQVLSNLLTNAAKYTDPDGHIVLRAVTEPAWVVISVSDTGIGIPSEAMSNLFGMFSQVSSGKDRSEGGLGIGLALAKGLVGLHGGTIEARSAGSECGSEFIVRLPLRDLADSEAAATARSSVEKPLQRKILIADDNRDAAESLALLLQMEGHEVTVVHDGREALTAFEKVRPQAALLDIGMPGLNGYEIARQIRRAPHGQGVTLIAVTGWGQESDKAQALAAGFNHHFTKPVEPEALSALIAGTAER